MRSFDPVLAFDALAHETRLAVLRLLIPAGPEGFAAGEISERVGLPPNALSQINGLAQNMGKVQTSKAS